MNNILPITAYVDGFGRGPDFFRDALTLRSQRVSYLIAAVKGWHDKRKSPLENWIVI